MTLTVRARHLFLATCLLATALSGGGCAALRVTDPSRTATEQFLMSVAASRAIDQLSTDVLRDRRVYMDTSYLSQATQPSAEVVFVLGELRAKLLASGVRLVQRRENAQIVIEVRTAGIGVDRLDYLLGIPATYVPGASSATANVAIQTPEIAILKTTKQLGFASIAMVAYWGDTGELVMQSGPFVGRTLREDFWFFGFGPRTVGNIPPAQSPK